MTIDIQAVNFNALPALSDYLNKKMEKIGTIYDRIISIKAYFKLLNNNTKQNKFSEIILHVPGEEIVVKKQGQSFEECIDLSLNVLKTKLAKEKNKKVK